MSQVLVTKSKIDDIANITSVKSGRSTPMTLTQIVDAISSITGGTVNLQVKSASPSDSSQIITADQGYDGLSRVNISAVVSNALSVYSNGQYTPSAGSYYNSVSVEIEDSKVNLQTKTVTPTTSPQSVVPDTGYHGLSSVTVNPIPSTYSDVSQVTATVNDVLSGETFVDSTGTLKTGNLVVKNYYVGASDPSSSLGSDGDLYLKI